MYKWVIEKIVRGRFKIVWQGYKNPFFEMSEDEIADILLEKFGEGWYQVFKFEGIGGGRWIRTTIFKGFVR